MQRQTLQHKTLHAVFNLVEHVEQQSFRSLPLATGRPSHQPPAAERAAPHARQAHPPRHAPPKAHLLPRRARGQEYPHEQRLVRRAAAVVARPPPHHHRLRPHHRRQHALAPLAATARGPPEAAPWLWRGARGNFGRAAAAHGVIRLAEDVVQVVALRGGLKAQLPFLGLATAWSAAACCVPCVAEAGGCAG